MSEMTEQKKIEKAIKFFKSIASDAKVVLDSGFGTNQNESNLVYRNRKTYAELAIQALEEKQKLSDERKAELLDGAIKAYEDREKLAIENEKNKALIVKQENRINGLIEDNEKLKEEFQKTYNQVIEVEKDVQKENGILRVELANKAFECIDLEKKVDELTTQLKSNEKSKNLKSEYDKLYIKYFKLEKEYHDLEKTYNEYVESLNKCLFKDLLYSIVDDTAKKIMEEYDGKEMADKLMEYENSKLVSNSDEFKVGDWVKSNFNDNGIAAEIVEVINKDYVKVVFNKHYYNWNVKNIEHAKPQNEEQKKPCFSDYENGCDVCSYAKKHEYEYPCCDCTHGQGTNEHFTTEEPNFEWAWECISFDDKFVFGELIYFTSEKDAIDWCESVSSGGYNTTYRKVCRRKEQ